MKIKEFIEKAIEGGWEPEDGWVQNAEAYLNYMETDDTAIRYAVLDPLAWKAVGKAEGWNESRYEPIVHPRYEWHQKMVDMIDVLAERKTIEQYLETL